MIIVEVNGRPVIASAIIEAWDDEELMESLYLDAMESAHDEWWEVSGPDPWYFPFQVGAWLPLGQTREFRVVTSDEIRKAA